MAELAPEAVGEVLKLADRLSGITPQRSGWPKRAAAADKAEALIAQGWKYVGTQPNGRVVLESVPGT